MRRSTERSRLLAEKCHLEEAEDPFPDLNAHAPLMLWVQEWADHLYVQDVPDFRPFEQARLVLSKATGFAPRTIESILQRHRKKAAGAAKREKRRAIPHRPHRSGRRA